MGFTSLARGFRRGVVGLGFRVMRTAAGAGVAGGLGSGGAETESFGVSVVFGWARLVKRARSVTSCVFVGLGVVSDSPNHPPKTQSKTAAEVPILSRVVTSPVRRYSTQM